MKKILIFLVILLAQVFTGVQNSVAQATVYVNWDAPGSCTCPLPGNLYWEVWCAVYDECSQPSETVFEDTQTIDGSATDYTFQLNNFCNPPSSQCYLVVACVTKLCPDGHGGLVKTCDGKFPGHVPWYTCQWLMTNGNQVNATIQW